MIGRLHALKLFCCLAFPILALAGPAKADPVAMRNLTKAMVLEARDYYKSVSFEAVESTFNDVTSER